MPTPVDPVVPGAALLTIQLTTGALQQENVVGIIVPSGRVLASTDAAFLVNTWWGAWRARYPSQTSCTGGILRDIRTAPSTAYIAAAPPQPTGGLTGTLLPYSACKLLALSTNLGNRRGRGRLYLGPLIQAEEGSDPNTIAAAEVSATNAAASTWSNALANDPSGFQWAVVSRTMGAAHQVSAAACRSGIATQRRRLR